MLPESNKKARECGLRSFSYLLVITRGEKNHSHSIID